MGHLGDIVYTMSKIAVFSHVVFMVAGGVVRVKRGERKNKKIVKALLATSAITAFCYACLMCVTPSLGWTDIVWTVVWIVIAEIYWLILSILECSMNKLVRNTVDSKGE